MGVIDREHVARLLAASAFLYLLTGSANAQEANPSLTVPAASLAAGTYRYNVIVRGTGDSDGKVEVTMEAGSILISSEVAVRFTSTYTSPGSTMPRFSSSRTYYHAKLALDPNAQVLRSTTEERPDQGSTSFGFASREDNGSMKVGLTRPQTEKYVGASDRWVAMDGLDFAGAFSLPYVLSRTGQRELSTFSTQSRRVSRYTCDSEVGNRPKEVPLSDLALRCRGNREDVTVWYSADTLVPDKIEIPGAGATLLRLPDSKK